MRSLTPLRRYELVFITGLTVLYVLRRLFDEVDRLDSMIGLGATGNGIPVGAFWRYLGDYNHTLNNNIPLIGGALLVLGAWFVFHNLAYPRLQARIDDRNGWLSSGAALLLLLAGVGLYHFLKVYVRHQHNTNDDIIGLATYSLYRKRTVLADTIGFAILIGTYELAYQYYRFLRARMRGGPETHFRLVSYLLLGGIALSAVSFALNGQLPETLWRWGWRMHDLLMMLGFGLIMLVLQEYVFSTILPLLRSPRASEAAIISSIGAYLLLIVSATALVFFASTNFYFRNSDAIVAFSGIILIGSLAIAFGRQAMNREKTVLQTQVSAGVAELASLRAQINPHFLFNALNSLYASALKEQGEKTADGIQKLGDMMRFMLQENNRDRIPLDKEIEYLRNYIAIQRMRIDESHPIEIRVTIQEPTRAIYLAPMLLTPFVENAFKHGISLRNASWIAITLTLDDTRLYFKVHNSRHPKPLDLPAGHDPESSNTGVGLDNVRKRLELIYPGRHDLTIQESGQDYFVALTLVYW